MKTVRYFLLVAFIIIALGFLGKLNLLFEAAPETLIVGLALLTLGACMYLVVAFLKSQERLEAGMVASGIPIYLGTLFCIMHWPGGDFLIVSFSGLILLLSIGICVYTYIKGRKVFEGICYLAFGLGTMFFSFKFLLWPYASIWFVLFILALIGSITYFVSQKPAVGNGAIASCVLAILLILFFFTRDSDAYRFKHLNALVPDDNFAENYARYSWYLYNEGNIEEAKKNLEIALYQIDNETNVYYENYTQRHDQNASIRYQHALDSVLAHQWKKYEYPEYYNVP
jgi:xanthine/uracil permease